MPECLLLLSAGAAVIGCAAMAAAIAANASMRRWRARCAALESHVATLGRELERVASSEVRGGTGLPREFMRAAARPDG